MNDLVSIIMPSYNTANYIKKAVCSVICQTYKHWELIIVDDASTDQTDRAILPFLSDGRIRYLKNEKNEGAAISRNRALREAKGRWIAFLDSDDLWVPDKLERQIQFMEDHHYAFTYTDYMIQLNGKWLPYVYTGPNIINRRKMYNYCYFSTITVMYDREKIGLIQIVNLRKNNDYAMWLQVISSGSKVKLIKWHYILYKDGLHKKRLISIILTVRNLFFGVIKKIKYREKTSVIPEISL